VVWSLARTKTGRDILKAIADGERDPKALASLAGTRVRGGRAAVERSLEGMQPGGRHPMLIRVHLDHITLLDRSVDAVEDEIEAALDAIHAARGITADGVPSPDAAALAAAGRLAEIPGVSRKLAMGMIAETGLDMTRFPAADNLVSWAGLAPVTRQPGPRSRRPGKGQGDACLKAYCTQAAAGAAGTDTFLGERLKPPVPPSGREQGQVRHRPIHPRHRVAPPLRPLGQVHRPRSRLARAQGRPRPQDPHPPPPAPGSRPRRDHHPRRLNPKPRRPGPMPQRHEPLTMPAFSC